VISTIIGTITKLKSNGSTSFTISQDGRIISEDEYYNDKLFVEVLINEGSLNYFDKDFTVVFDKNGYKNISSEEIYLLYPQLKQNFIDAGADFIDNIPNNEEISILFFGNKFFVNGNEFPLFHNLKSINGKYYDEFRDCVGYWWFLPGVNVVTCGSVSIVRWAFELK